MLEVKASEIVTADKMRGIGPANIIFTAGPNPVAEDRRGVAKVTAGGESKNVTITQAAGEQVVVIPEFDYLVLRYGWESEDGSDFDTATGFTNTGISEVDNKFVGWSKQWLPPNNRWVITLFMVVITCSLVLKERLLR